MGRQRCGAPALVMDGGVIIVRVGYSDKIHVPWSEKPFLFCALRCFVVGLCVCVCVCGVFLLLFLVFFFLPCVVVCAWNPSTQEAET